MKLIASNNLKSLDAGTSYWQSLNDDPQFAIDGCWRVAGAKIRVTGRIDCEGGAKSNPVMYLDAGRGMSERDCIQFQLLPSGDFVAEVQLPKTLKALRFDPVSHECTFSILNFDVCVLHQSLTLFQRSYLLFTRNFSKIEPVQDAPPVQFTPNDYRRWLEEYEIKSDKFAELHDSIAAWKYRPLISILLPTFNTSESWL
jgi:hypothetical protein